MSAGRVGAFFSPLVLAYDGGGVTCLVGVSGSRVNLGRWFFFFLVQSSFYGFGRWGYSAVWCRGNCVYIEGLRLC